MHLQTQLAVSSSISGTCHFTFFSTTTYIVGHLTTITCWGHWNSFLTGLPVLPWLLRRCSSKQQLDGFSENMGHISLLNSKPRVDSHLILSKIQSFTIDYKPRCTRFSSNKRSYHISLKDKHTRMSESGETDFIQVTVDNKQRAELHSNLCRADLEFKGRVREKAGGIEGPEQSQGSKNFKKEEGGGYEICMALLTGTHNSPLPSLQSADVFCN